MYCSKCGSQIQDTSNFCPSCGQQVSKATTRKVLSTEATSQFNQAEKSSLARAVTIFIPTFLVILVINQMFYGGCFKGYCLAAAFPRVTVISALLTWLIFSITKEDN